MNVVRVIAFLGAAIVSACAVGPNYESPVLPVPEGYASAAPALPTSEILWWRGFEDEALNAMIDVALEENLEIERAYARLAEAQAFVDASRSDLFPTIDGNVAAIVATDFDNSTEETLAGAVVHNYVLDVFGGRRRGVEAARAGAASELHSVENARRLIISAVGVQYVEYRRTLARLELLDETLEFLNQTLELAEARDDVGLGSFNVRLASADIARARAQRPLLLIARAEAENSLAILLGRPPRIGFVPRPGAATIPQYSGGPPVGIPADLIRQRADVRAAEASLAAATAFIGVEAADLYPRLSIPGVISADLAGSGGNNDTVIGALAVSLHLPLFDGGRRRAEVRAAEQRARGALATYEQTLLQSLVEVENALVAIRSFEHRRADLSRALVVSEQAFAQVNALHREGMAPFFDIVDTQRTLIRLREDYVDSEAQLAGAIIALYRATGATTHAVDGVPAR